MLTYAVIGEGRAGLLIQSNLRVARSLAMTMMRACARLVSIATLPQEGDDQNDSIQTSFCLLFLHAITEVATILSQYRN